MEKKPLLFRKQKLKVYSLHKFARWLETNTSLSYSTIKQYVKKVRTMLKTLWPDLENKRAEDIIPILNAYIRRKSTQYELPYSIILWVRWHYKLKNKERLKLLSEEILRVKLQNRERPYHYVSREEFQETINKLPSRKEALIAVIAYHTGARIREVLAIQERSVELEENIISIILRGKGNRHRKVFIDRTYWPEFQPLFKGDPHNYLFLEVDLNAYKDKFNRDTKLESYYKKVWANLKKTGVAWSHHHLRSTKITNVARRSDMAIAQRVAGHSRLETTTRYIQVDEAKIKEEMLKDETLNI